MPTLNDLLHDTRAIASIYRAGYTSQPESDAGRNAVKRMVAAARPMDQKYGDGYGRRMSEIAFRIVVSYDKQPQSDELVYDGQ